MLISKNSIKEAGKKLRDGIETFYKKYTSKIKINYKKFKNSKNNNFIYLNQNHLILALHFDKLLFYIHHYCYHYFLKFQYQYLNKK